MAARGPSNAVLTITHLGLMQSVNAAVDLQFQKRNGLPAIVKVVGSNKAKSGEYTGDYTSATDFSSLVSDAGNKVGLIADGISVDGLMTSLSISATSNNIASFSVGLLHVGSTDGGASASAIDYTGSGIATTIGTPKFMEELTVTVGGAVSGMMGFNLDLNWDVEALYNTSGAVTGGAFKTFEGKFSITTNAQASETLDTTPGGAAISVCGISMKGVQVKSSQNISVGDLVGYTREYEITEITA
jgi:hypothetical protein